MQHLSVKAIGIANTDEKAFLLTSIGNQISRKVVFDENEEMVGGKMLARKR